jgi:hypothetical protein
LDKINRIAANLGVDEVIATAVQEHLKRIGEIPADEPGETDALEGPESPTETDAVQGLASPAEEQQEGQSALNWVSV